MPFEYDFRALMRQTVYEDPLSSRTSSGYAHPTYSTGTRVTHSYCRVVDKQTLVRAMDGTEQVAKTVVYLGSTAVVGVESRYTMPDGSTPPLLNISAFPDEDGRHHTVLYFGGRTRASKEF